MGQVLSVSSLYHIPQAIRSVSDIEQSAVRRSVMLFRSAYDAPFVCGKEYLRRGPRIPAIRYFPSR